MKNIIKNIAYAVTPEGLLKMELLGIHSFIGSFTQLSLTKYLLCASNICTRRWRSDVKQTLNFNIRAVFKKTLC